MARDNPKGARLRGKAHTAGKRSEAGKQSRKPTVRTRRRTSLESTGSAGGNARGRPLAREDPVAAALVQPDLSPQEIEEFRQILLEKRAQLLGDIRTLHQQQKNRNESGELSSVPFHPADVGSDNFEQEFAIGLMGNEQDLLREIEEALDRIAKGTYGVCPGTNKPIAKARLQAKPWAKYSIEYTRLIEKGLARPIRNR